MKLFQNIKPRNAIEWSIILVALIFIASTVFLAVDRQLKSDALADNNVRLEAVKSTENEEKSPEGTTTATEKESTEEDDVKSNPTSKDADKKESGSKPENKESKPNQSENKKSDSDKKEAASNKETSPKDKDSKEQQEQKDQKDKNDKSAVDKKENQDQQQQNENSAIEASPVTRFFGNVSSSINNWLTDLQDSLLSIVDEAKNFEIDEDDIAEETVEPFVYDAEVADSPALPGGLDFIDYDTPVYDPVYYEEPVYEEPVYEEPIVEQPVVGEPTNQGVPDLNTPPANTTEGSEGTDSGNPPLLPPINNGPGGDGTGGNGAGGDNNSSQGPQEETPPAAPIHDPQAPPAPATPANPPAGPQNTPGGQQSNSGNTGGYSVAPSAGEIQNIQMDILNLINQMRVNSGLQALAHDPTLQAIASLRAQELYSYYSSAHYRPDGSFSLSWIQYTYGMQYAQGENIARFDNVGRIDSGFIFNSFNNSGRGHHEIMMNPNNTIGAIGIYAVEGTVPDLETGELTQHNGRFFVCMNFGY